MKKLLVLSLLGVCFSQAQAQVTSITSSGVMNTTGSIGSAQVNAPSTGLNTQSYNVTSSNGTTQSVMSPISNVYISTPASLQNLGSSSNSNNGTVNNTATSTGNSGTVVIDPVANLNKQKGNNTVTPGQSATADKAASDATASNTPTPVKVPVQQATQAQVSKPVGQTLTRLPDIYTPDISGFNNTTIEQYEDQGEKQTEAAYKNFLSSH
jgi:hypothetical protein